MGLASDQITSYLELVFTSLALISIFRAREVRAYWALVALLVLSQFPEISNIVIARLVHGGLLSFKSGYFCYFCGYWFCFAVDAVLSLAVILGVFRLAMKPLRGLERLGTLMFRWAAVMSIALAVSIGLTSRGASTNPLITVMSQFQRFSDVLILCLLVFVCFAISPMGLTFRSRMFGVSLGLGAHSSVQLICAALLWNRPSLHSKLDFGMALADLFTVTIWIVYFALPEPKARIIVLPTTSPYLQWNRISEALGDEPGYVAVAGIPPEVFSPAEVDIMFRASAKMRPLFDEPYSALSDGPEPSITSLTA